MLIHADTKPDRDRLQGILRFARMHPEWNILILPGHPATQFMLKSENWKPDGIIATAFALAEDRKLLAQWGSIDAAVIIDADSPTKILAPRKQVCIDCDNRLIGRVAANFYLKRGFQHFAYIPSTRKRRWSDEREQAFVKQISDSGNPEVFVYDVPERHRRSWGQDSRRIAQWLSNLPKPCGLLAANDSRAYHTLQVAKLAGIRVPEHISVLGVDNDEILCDFCNPPISSIFPDFERCGYQSADLLNQLMNGRNGLREAYHYGTQRIIERSSTDDANGTVRLVSKAKQIIQESTHLGLNVFKLANTLRISTRTLERRFAEAGLQSPEEVIRQHRFSLVLQQLSNTTDSIESIALRCGFRSATRLQIAFKSMFGTSPGSYRAKHQVSRHDDNPASRFLAETSQYLQPN